MGRSESYSDKKTMTYNTGGARKLGGPMWGQNTIDGGVNAYQRIKKWVTENMKWKKQVGNRDPLQRFHVATIGSKKFITSKLRMIVMNAES